MREFTVGGVLRRVTALVRLRLGLLLGLAVLFVGVPYAVIFAGLRLAQPDKPGLSSAASVVYWLGSLLLQPAVIRAAVDAGETRPSRFGALIGTSARFFFPLLAINLLSGIVIGAASILLLFPGIMLMCRWYVAAPVEVAERAGIIASFGRSAALTLGVRWRVFGVLLLMTVLNSVCYFALGFLGGVAAGFDQAKWSVVAASAAGTSISTLINALFYTATYLELREVREGVMSEELVSVFS